MQGNCLRRFLQWSKTWIEWIFFSLKKLILEKSLAVNRRRLCPAKYHVIDSSKNGSASLTKNGLSAAPDDYLFCFRDWQIHTGFYFYKNKKQFFRFAKELFQTSVYIHYG